MTTRSTAAFTKPRIVTLFILGLMIAALAFIRLASQGSDPPGVPDGARAGDLVLEPCEYDAEDGTLAADCGTLVVPENRAKPDSRLLAMPITRIHATSPASGRPVFHLDGGPGHTNMEFPAAARLATGRDVVLLGYRGVDGSVRLDCPEVASALKRSKDFLSESTLESYASAFGDCAGRLAAEGVDLAGYTLTQRADDLEAARVALGYGRIDLLSESAGTRLAMVYSWRYAANVGRSVMIGANPPGHFVWDPAASDAQIRRYAARCAADAGCGRRSDDLAETLATAVEHAPDRWLFLPIKDGNIRVTTFYGLMESGEDAAPLSGPTVLDAWLASAEGDASGLWFMSLLGDIAFPESFVWGDMAAVAMADAAAARHYFESGPGRGASILGNPATEFQWAGGRLLDTWPEGGADREYASLRRSDIETLLINGELDGATPLESAQAMLPFLPNGRHVVLDGIGHTIDFWSEQSRAADHLVSTFLDRGQVDTSLYTTGTVDFTPVMSAPAVAKIVAGAMAGVPILALISVVAVGARRRGLGRRTSATIRAAWPVLLGSAGWLTAVAIVLPAWSGMPIDDVLLVTLSVAIPIGVGTWLAATRGVRDGLAPGLDFTSAMAGALVGSWLGFNSASGSVAILTAIVGASVGANLVLTAIDIATDEKSVQSPAVEGVPHGEDQVLTA